MTSDANDFVNAKKETSARRVQKLRSIRQKKANAHVRNAKTKEKGKSPEDEVACYRNRQNRALHF